MTCMHDYETVLPLLACPLNILQKVEYDSINCPKIFLIAKIFMHKLKIYHYDKIKHHVKITSFTLFLTIQHPVHIKILNLFGLSYELQNVHVFYKFEN